MSRGVNGNGGPLEGIRVIDWTIWQLGPVSTRKMAPEHGENTDEVLTEILGYTSEQIADLREAGATL